MNQVAQTSERETKDVKTSICGCQHEAFRLIPKLRKEVIKILDQLPSKEPIDFSDISWKLFFNSVRHKNPDGIEPTKRVARGCTYGCPELCNHGSRNLNQNAWYARTEEVKKMQNMPESSPQEKQRKEEVYKKILYKNALLQYRDALIEDFVVSLYSPLEPNARYYRYKDIQGKLHNFNLSIPFYPDTIAIHAHMHRSDFLEGSTKENIQTCMLLLQELTHNIQKFQVEIESELEPSCT